MNRLFVDVMNGMGSPVRLPWKFTPYGRALHARAELRRMFAELVPARRKSAGRDMLSVLCSAVSEDGERFSDDDIVDHMLFLLMAAHDTTTSALTNLIMELGRRPELQARLRKEAQSVPPGDEAALSKLSGVYDAFREVLRLYPPVHSIPRRTLRECEVHGYRVPANTQVWVTPDVNHRDPSIWTNPEAFEPERFSEPRAEHKKHRFAFIPFGGGAHTCLGLQFSELQVKALLRPLLAAYSWRVADGAAREMQYIPFVKPKDDLPIVLTTV